nr:hypothetical protein [uncultured Kingella sp.]
MIRRWLALTYYLYALRLAALSHFILIHYTCRVGIYAHAVQYVGFRQPETVYHTSIWQSYRKTDTVAACAFRIRRQPETVFRLPCATEPLPLAACWCRPIRAFSRRW